MDKIFLRLNIKLLFFISRFYAFKYNFKLIKRCFISNGFNFEKAKNKLDLFYEYKFPSQLNKQIDMISNHYLLIAAISIAYDKKKILEIGTYDGFCASFISYCFPNSEITTIDLKDDDNSFLETYDRNNSQILNNHIKIRNQNISLCNNVNFIQKNSNLFFSDNSTFFDFIFIDGDHKNPTVTSDILNSLKYLNKNGLILIDDIIDKNRPICNPYDSHDAFNTILKLKNKKKISYELFPKRSFFPHNTSLLWKSVALVKKID